MRGQLLGGRREAAPPSGCREMHKTKVRMGSTLFAGDDDGSRGMAQCERSAGGDAGLLRSHHPLRDGASGLGSGAWRGEAVLGLHVEEAGSTTHWSYSLHHYTLL